MTLPNLPLDGSPDEHEIEFRYAGLGTVVAVVFNDYGLKVDEVRGHTFREAYDKVREVYPQATWDGLDVLDEEEGE